LMAFSSCILFNTNGGSEMSSSRGVIRASPLYSAARPSDVALLDWC
jgi:hypothetical protein